LQESGLAVFGARRDAKSKLGMLAGWREFRCILFAHIILT